MLTAHRLEIECQTERTRLPSQGFEDGLGLFDDRFVVLVVGAGALLEDRPRIGRLVDRVALLQHHFVGARPEIHFIVS